LTAATVALGMVLGSAAQAAQDCKRPAGGKVHNPKVVNFDFDSSKLRPEQRAELEKIAARFAGNPNIEVCLVGMADRVGDQDYNKKLAQTRAEVVADFLKSAGLKDNKYQIVARGQPYGDNDWVGKLLGSGEKESDRRVDVLFMER
jgi:outer membrane protein OmpA-like peptidoglycan-associated protein